MSEEPKKPANPLATVAVIGGAVGGWALAQYSGPALWIPLAITLVLFFAGAKTPLRPKHFGGAICVAGGHLIWFLVSCLMTGAWAELALDIIILGTAIVWLWARPSLWAALFLGLVLAGSLVINVPALGSYAIGTVAHKSQLVHCLWRVIAFALLVAGYRNWQIQRKAVAPPPPIPESV